MAERRDIHGLWWLPTNPSERWIGTLSLTPDRSPRLDLSVPKGFFSLPLQNTPVPVIQGCDECGRPITLLAPHFPSSHGGAALTQLSFSGGYAILGIELAGASAFVVNSLSFRIQHLYEWAGISGFQKNEHLLHDLRIHYIRPEDQVFAIDSDLSVEFRAAYSLKNGFREKRIEEDLIVGFQSKEGINLSRLKELLGAFRYLLHFAVLNKAFPMKITAEKDNHGYTVGDQYISHEIEIWHSGIRERVESESAPDRWVFRFSDLQSRFSDFFKNWLKFLRDFQEAAGCYSTTIYHSLTAEVQFLCLTQALEAYHGIKNASHQRTNFRTKIRELAILYGSHLSGLVSNIEDFVDIVRDNRNYYTHHNPAGLTSGRVLGGSDLLRLNEKLKLIFQMCVLTEIGIPADRFARLRRQLASHIFDYP